MSDIRKLSASEFIFSQVTSNGNNEISLRPGTDGKFTISSTDPGTDVDLEIMGGTVINGDLQVQGTLSFVDQTDFSIADKIITLNEGETGSGVGSPGHAGLEIDRGTLSEATLLFQEAGVNSYWDITYSGNTPRFRGIGSPTDPTDAANRQFVLDEISTAINNANTDDIQEASNLYFTDTRSRQSISVDNDTGFGTLTYDINTGIITLEGVTESEINDTVGNLLATSNLNGIDYTYSTGILDAEITEPIFKNVQVNGTTQFSASVNNDIINFIPGSNVDISASSTGNTVEFSINSAFLDADTLDGLDASDFVQISSSQTITATKTFSAPIIINYTANQSNRALNAGRNINTGNGLLGGGNLTSDRTFSIDTDVVVDTGSIQTISGAKTFSNNLDISGGNLTVTNGGLDVDNNSQFFQDVVISGDLTVSGDVSTVNAEDLFVEDNKITLNFGETGNGVTSGNGTSGVIIDRGTATNFVFQFDESSDKFEVGLVGSTVPVSVEGHVHDTSDITTGTFADARIAETNVTQHQAAIDHDSLTGFVLDEHRPLNDTQTTTTNLWSADKIQSELNAIDEGSAIWGNITGTLSNQTDLQSALDGKSNTGHTHTLSDITDSGTAAGRDIGTSNGNVMEQTSAGLGGFGYGAEDSGNSISNADANDLTTTQFAYVNNDGNAVNVPIGTVGGHVLVNNNQGSTGYAVQDYYLVDNDRVFFRRLSNGTWQSWNEYYHTGNLDPLEPADVGSMAYEDAGDYATLTGNTFTGNQTISRSNPSLIINETSGSSNAHVYFRDNGENRGILFWQRSSNQMVLRSLNTSGNTQGQLTVSDTVDTTVPLYENGTRVATLGSNTFSGNQYIQNSAGLRLDDGSGGDEWRIRTTATLLRLTAWDGAAGNAWEFDGVNSTFKADGDVSFGHLNSPLYGLDLRNASTGLMSRFWNTATDGQGLLIRAGSAGNTTRALEVSSTDDVKRFRVNSDGLVEVLDTLHVNGQIMNSSAALQVNGFSRMGDIYLHEGGASPTTTNKQLRNSSGLLQWDAETLATRNWVGSSDQTITGSKLFDRGFRIDDSTTTRHRILKCPTSHYSGSNSITGTIEIKLPNQTADNTFITAFIRLYDSYGNTTFVEAGGYARNSQSPANWSNNHVRILGTGKHGIDKVRFGYAGDGSPVILLSNNGSNETGSDWSSYVVVSVDEIHLGWTGFDNANNNDPSQYSVDFITDETGIGIDNTLTGSSLNYTASRNWVNSQGFISGISSTGSSGISLVASGSTVRTLNGLNGVSVSSNNGRVDVQLTGDTFNSSGTYSGLRAQSTTKGDVGLGNVDNVKQAQYSPGTGSFQVFNNTSGNTITRFTGRADSISLSTYAENQFGSSNHIIHERVGGASSSGDDTLGWAWTSFGSINLGIKSNNGVIIGQPTGGFPGSRGMLRAEGLVQGNGLDASSDMRLKKNWDPITDPWPVLEPLSSAIGEFDWIKDNRHDSGFNAQKVRKIKPHLVHGNEETGTLYMSQISVIPYLVSGVNNLKDENKQLKEENKQIKSRLNKIENMLEKLLGEN